MFASRALTGAEKKLSKPGEGMLSNNLGYGEIFIYFLYGKHFTLETDQEASSFHIQETYGRHFTQNTKIGCEKLSIPAV